MLHEERVSLAQETRKLEISAITAVAALYAWLATHLEVRGAIWYIGVPLVLLSSFRSFVLGGRILFIKTYLRQIEQQLFRDKSQLLGYESYFFERTKPISKWYLHIRYTAVVMWIALLLVTAIAPSFLGK
jgi:hypothetical protein